MQLTIAIFKFRICLKFVMNLRQILKTKKDNPD
jgi:hypothetical protein